MSQEFAESERKNRDNKDQLILIKELTKDRTKREVAQEVRKINYATGKLEFAESQVQLVL